METKKSEGQYVCKNCGKRFASRAYWKIHIERCAGIIHRVIPSDEIMRQVKPKKVHA